MNATRYTREGNQDVNPEYGVPRPEGPTTGVLTLEMPWSVPWPGDTHCAVHPTCQRVMSQGPLRIDTDVAVYVCLCLACVNDIVRGVATQGTTVMVRATYGEEETTEC